MPKRRKQIFKYYLIRWKQHKFFDYGLELRLNDFYRLTEIVKRGGVEWWLKQPHKQKTTLPSK